MSKENDSFFTIEEKEINVIDLFLTLKRRQFIIYGTVLSSLLVMIAYILIVSPVYRSSFIIRVPVVSSIESSKIIEELGIAIEEGSIDILAKRLGISKNKAENIVSLESTYSMPQLTNKYIEISLGVNDPSIIIELKDRILSFLNNNKYVKERLTIQREQLVRLSQDIQSRINNIENFRNVLSEQITAQITAGNKAGIGFNPMGMERDVIEFKKELRSVADSIELLKGFELLTEPYIPQKPVKPRKRLYLAITGFVSLLLGILLVLIVEKFNKSID